MEKIKVTKQQRANALFARDVMWPSVPVKNVAEDLGEWLVRAQRRDGTVVADCGSVGCFGGWVAQHPHFQAQGVVPGEYCGAPQLVDGGMSYAVAGKIFGATDLFAARDSTDGLRGTDHEIVTKRLNKLIRNSVVI